MNCYNEDLPKDAQLDFWGEWVYICKGTVLASERTNPEAIRSAQELAVPDAEFISCMQEGDTGNI